VRAAYLGIGALCLVALSACKDESHFTPHKAIDPPVASPNAIPDAPVSGSLAGVPFQLRDARYIIDRRLGYAHTDIKLSAGKADTACGPLTPTTATSVWLRLEGAGRIDTKDVRLGPDAKDTWTVHYQVFNGERWVGVGDGSAVLTIHEPGADGKLNGAIGVCFDDEKKSCVSGSFDAVACPPVIDQPVRGALPPETIPEAYRLKLLDAGAASAAPTDSGTPDGAAQGKGR
jgi:hypothetical protein